MAAMFVDFTSSDRRKKVVTYGKSSRLSKIPPPTLPSTSNEDAPPSPERPRKRAGALNGSLIGGTSKTGKDPGNAHAKGSDMDVFDMPSDDEEFALRKPTKKLQVKRRTPEEDTGLPIGADESPRETRKPVQAMRPPQRKPEPARPAAVTTKKTEKPEQPPKPAQIPPPTSIGSIAPQVTRKKAAQTTEVAEQTIRNEGLVQRPKAKAKAPPRPTAPAPVVAKSQKNAKTSSALSSNRAPTKPAVKPADHDIFDVPVSDDEPPLTAKKPSNKIPAITTKQSARKPRLNSEDAVKSSAESDDSNASKKRKRPGPASSVAAAAKSVIEQKRESSAPQRSRKHQKTEAGASPGHDSQEQAAVRPPPRAQRALPSVNKPRRTGLRTVPVIAPGIAKGKSSPATLNRMLPNRQPPKASLVSEAPETAEQDDQTMYEIPDPLTTPVRPSKASVPSSTTPRQKVLFGGLLGESSSETPMPSISTLQLTDHKPKSLVGTLSRSKSDVTYSAQARKTRLIDTLKHVESSSEDEDEDSTSESGRDSGKHSVSRQDVRKPPREPRDARTAAEPSSDIMDVDVQANIDSQTSQATSGIGNRPRLTYAMSRSYLQEANPEDDLMVSMDLEGSHNFDVRKNDIVSDDEPEQASQTQAYHELKRQGRNYAFESEAGIMIEDISSTTAKSTRRSAMMELCTKMANESFTSQLLDSSLAHQFFQNLATNGEVIFDFAAAVATVFVLQTNPPRSVLEQINEARIITTLVQLFNYEMDVEKISKDRKTNLSKITKDSVVTFRTLIDKSSIWGPAKIDKVSPQLVALKAMELLITSLRKGGNTNPLVDHTTISQLIGIASTSYERVEAEDNAVEDMLILDMVISILESTSATRQKQTMWLTADLQQLARLMPVFFRPDAAASTMLAVKLCMNLTNNKPKACQPFSGKAFVQPLMLSITEKFQKLDVGLAAEERTEVLESLILSLGAMINLGEFSDQARLNVDDGEQMISTLVQIFLEGSERALRADSMEESHSGVAVGYLTVLLGNLCLNKFVRNQVRARLPEQRLDVLIESIKDFVRVHEHADSKTQEFEGAEGQETWQTYTARLLLVVEKLERAAT